jgi:hypothetical protein
MAGGTEWQGLVIERICRRLYQALGSGDITAVRAPAARTALRGRRAGDVRRRNQLRRCLLSFRCPVPRPRARAPARVWSA